MLWLEKLHNARRNLLPALLADPSKWSSLIINRRKPITHRAFTMLGEDRLILHEFEQFDQTSEEGFFHPHPWAGAFQVVDGAYFMEVGYTPDRFIAKPTVLFQMELTEGSCYEISDPLVWHRVIPLTPRVRTIMLNGPPWSPDVAHTQVRTTKGKDLEQMSPERLKEHLDFFQQKLYGR